MNPVPYADIVTTTTHKTLRGPRGGMILCKAEHAKAVDKAVFPCTQGGPLMHVIAAKAVCFQEALQPEFSIYQKQVINNAHMLADALLAGGVDLISGGTDNHMMLLDLRRQGISGRELEERLHNVNITVNKNMIPDDPRKPSETSGIRIGTPAVTTRGMDEDAMQVIACCILDVLYGRRSDAEIRISVKELTETYRVFLDA